MRRRANLGLVVVAVCGLLAQCGPAWSSDGNCPISHWTFNKGSGSTAYDSVGSNDGTIYGASWANGMFGSALSFDGVDDYVGVGNDNSLKPPLPVTLSAWIKLSSSDSTQYIVALDDQTSKYYGIWWHVRSAGDLAVCYGDGGGQGPADRRSKVGTTVLDADTWYHIAAVLNGPVDMNLYVDGIDDGGTYSGTGGSLTYSSASSLIGIRHGSAYALGGKIDDVRVYERALSAEEVWEVYQTDLGTTPHIILCPETLKFYADEGGSNPASQTISISNIGVGVLNYQIMENCSWLEVDPNTGSSEGEPNEVTVSVDMSGLTEGSYNCELTVSDPNAENSPQTVATTFAIYPSVLITCIQTPEEPEVTIGYVNTEGQPVRSFALDISIDSGTITDANCISADYYLSYTYPVGIQINDEGEVTDWSLSDANGAGAGIVTVDLTSLYNPNDPNHNQPPPDEDDLLLVTVTEECQMYISENELRGGVVMEDLSAVDVNAPGCDVVLGPACWNYDCFDCGDTNGDCLLTFADLNVIRGAWPPNPYNPCADLNKDGFMTFTELLLLIDNWPPNGACANCGSCTPIP